MSADQAGYSSIEVQSQSFFLLRELGVHVNDDDIRFFSELLHNLASNGKRIADIRQLYPSLKVGYSNCEPLN